MGTNLGRQFLLAPGQMRVTRLNVEVKEKVWGSL